jgi:tripartite-type tricarboxylate transporter receptor subunit TctC
MASFLANRRSFLIGAGGAALALAAPKGAAAQTFPEKPVRVVVPFPPGGALDALARIISQKMGEDLGQQFVIDNRPGATGHTGSEVVARSAPDGYTLLFTASSTQVVSPHMMRLNYNPLEELVPVGLAAVLDNIIVVHPSVPARTLPELIAHAKANPGRISFASTGVGSNLHLAGEMLNMMAGIEMVHVPYSSPQMMPDLLSGRVQLLVGNIPQVQQQIQTGSLRPIAATSARRLPAFPDLPTVAETLPGYEVIAWGMLMAPARTPAPVIATLNTALRQALDSPPVREAFARQQFEPRALTPEESLRFMREQSDNWARIIREARIPPISQ